MKKVSGLALAASLALGVLTVAGPAAAETVTTVYNDVQDEIIDVDLENGFGFTYNVDTGDTQYWKQDDDGEWFEIDPPSRSSSNGIESTDNWDLPPTD